MSAIPSPSPPSKPIVPHDSEADHYRLAQKTLTDLLHLWSHTICSSDSPTLRSLENLQTKFEQNVVSIAAFGMVNRGKSAVLNALLGQALLTVGPLNGVTRTSTSVAWDPKWDWHSTHSESSSGPDLTFRFQLIDTPGLNEVDGEAREQLAWSVAQSADLILFIISADMTQVEYQALLELRTLLKPILLVFNKIDLYPDQDREAIYAQLTSPKLKQLVSPEEIVMVAASPNPVKVRVHWPDTAITYEWERPEPIMDQLKQEIFTVLQREGGSLLALNALTQMSQLHETLIHQWETQVNIWQPSWALLLAKSSLIGLNPLPGLDLLLGLGADLVAIQIQLRDLKYPLNRHLLQPLGRQLSLNIGVLLGVEVISIWLMQTSLLTLDAWLGMPLLNTATYWLAATFQASAAAYSLFRMKRQIPSLLKTDLRSGPYSPRSTIQTILDQLHAGSILSRLQQEVRDQWGLKSDHGSQQLP